ncbi:class I SAM-dependent methyltransferase [Acidobacteria bacterium AH-259-O06]|nr:class I SAM-dependent methyltransferase [Acidobacteria bacterium AH-259-O06]
MDYKRIDFDQELNNGPQTYNETLGKWWQSRSSDSAHTYAYRRIAEHISSFFARPPQRIIDYACGAGHMLTRLSRSFPDSRLAGIDRSSFLLKLAKKRLRQLGKDWPRRVELIETELPDFSLPQGQADLVIFVFPNIVPNPDNDQPYEENGFHHKADAAVAKHLAWAREPDPEEETVEDDSETVYDSMLTDKVISRNLRGLLKKGGICVRAHYANAPRDELSRLVRQRLAFEEGSLDEPVSAHRAERLFAFLGSTYFRSKVTEDVYHQTRDESDKRGGYLLTTLLAV